MGLVEYEDVRYEIRMKKEAKSSLITDNHVENIIGHSNFIFFGSIAGFEAILTRIVYNILTNQLPKTFGEENQK